MPSDVDEVVRVILRELRMYLSPTDEKGENWSRHRGLCDVSLAALTLATQFNEHDAQAVAMVLLDVFKPAGNTHQDFRNLLTLLDMRQELDRMISTHEYAADELGE